MNLDYAVALLEQGFPAERVEVALQQCSTMDEALKWLRAAEGATGKRRIVRKKSAPEAPLSIIKAEKSEVGAADSDAATAASDVPSPGSTIEPASSRASSERGGSIDRRQQSTEFTGFVAKASAASSFESPEPTSRAASSLRPPAQQENGRAIAADDSLILGPRDGTAWWKEAAARWPSIVAELREELESTAANIGECPPSSSSSSTVADASAAAANSSLEERTPKRARIEAAQASPSDGGDAAAGRDIRPSIHSSPPAGKSGAPASSSPATEAIVIADASSGPSVVAEPRLSIPGRGSPQAKASAGRRSRRASTPGSAMKHNLTDDICAICCNDIAACQAVQLHCGHGWYCAECILRHTEARLAMGRASVTCPECNAVLAERFLRKLLPENVIERLHARSVEQAVSSAADLWACPTPNCPMRVALEDYQLPRLTCTHCKKESCLKCGAQPYHKRMTCEEHAKRVRMRTLAKGSKTTQQERQRLADEESLMQWIRETGTKQCPTCKMAVSKQNLENQATQYSECHKMLCRSCGTKFCFKCLAILSDTYTCGCTRVDHGFVDPKTGKRVEHLRVGSAKAAAKRKAGR